MTSNDIIVDEVAGPRTSESNLEFSERARKNLWLDFSNMGSYSEANQIPIIVHGQGTYIWDADGKRYFDGLSGLFTSQLGHGRADIAEVAAKQMTELEFFPIWTYAHPRAIELAEKIASLTPGDLNRVFFTSGGGEAVESAWKLARQYHLIRGDVGRYKAISRESAYHGTTLGALTITSVNQYREPFGPLVPGAVKVPNTNFFHATEFANDYEGYGLWSARQIEEAILREGPETVAAVFLEPVQNAGGCLTPPPGYWQEVRAICDRHGVILISDEVICAFGRLGTWFGAQKFDYVPDIILCAKGLTSGYAPLGAMIVSDRVAEPFIKGEESFLHGFTFAGHPVSCAVALKNIEIFETEGVLENVIANEGYFKSGLESLLDLSVVGDVRGNGYFLAIELTKDRDTRMGFDADEANRLLRGYLSPELFRRGLHCRTDDRAEPVVQLSPPLISTRDDIDFIVDTLRDVLTGAPTFL
jgi:adenosylmethionine-8-amino-7-oxononanoate aminotransferase